MHDWVKAVPEEFTKGDGDTTGGAGSKSLAKREGSTKAQEKLDRAQLMKMKTAVDTLRAVDCSSPSTLQAEEELENKFDALRAKMGKRKRVDMLEKELETLRERLAKTVEDCAAEELKLKGLKEAETHLVRKVRLFEDKLHAAEEAETTEEEEMVEEEVDGGEENAEDISPGHTARSKSLERVTALEEQVTAIGSKFDQLMAILQQQQSMRNAALPVQQAPVQMQAPAVALQPPVAVQAPAPSVQPKASPVTPAPVTVVTKEMKLAALAKDKKDKEKDKEKEVASRSLVRQTSLKGAKHTAAAKGGKVPVVSMDDQDADTEEDEGALGCSLTAALGQASAEEDPAL